MSALVSMVGVNGWVSWVTPLGVRDRETRNRRSERVCLRLVSGAPGEIRTPNLLIRSQMLYPLSYGRPS